VAVQGWLGYYSETQIRSSEDSVINVLAVTSPVKLAPNDGEDTSAVVARHRSGLVSRLFHTWGIQRRSHCFDISQCMLARGSVYFD